jgi:hypothetical protein
MQVNIFLRLSRHLRSNVISPDFHPHQYDKRQNGKLVEFFFLSKSLLLMLRFCELNNLNFIGNAMSSIEGIHGHRGMTGVFGGVRYANST